MKSIFRNRARRYSISFAGTPLPGKNCKDQTKVMRRSSKKWRQQLWLLQDLRRCWEWIHCVIWRLSLVQHGLFSYLGVLKIRISRTSGIIVLFFENIKHFTIFLHC